MSGVTIMMKSNVGEQKLRRFCRKGFGKILRVTKLEALTIGSSISLHARKMHRFCIEDGLVLAVICRCAHLAMLGVGGGRTQTGLDQRDL